MAIEARTQTYIDRLDPGVQADAEEWIASRIYDLGGHIDGPCETDTICEEAASNLGKDILLEILARFRPDLLETR